MRQSTITISRTDYRRLKQTAEKFEMLRNLLACDLFEQPPTKDTKRILKELKATGQYNPNFLQSIAEGLRESRYFRRSV